MEFVLPMEYRVLRPDPTAAPRQPEFEKRPPHDTIYIPRVVVLSVLGMLVAVSVASAAGCWIYRKNRRSALAHAEVEAHPQVV